MKQKIYAVLGALVAVCAAIGSEKTAPRPAFSFTYGDRAVAGGDSLQVDGRLKVTVEAKSYPQYDATEWVLWFENPSKEKSAVLSDIRDGSFLVPLPPAPPKFAGDISVPGERAVITMNGCLSNDDYSMRDWVSAREFAPITRYFRPAAKVHEMRNFGARSSDGQAPFFEVTQGGQGAIIAIGWTGGWRARFEDGADGVRVETGLARARFYLEPGERLRTSRVLVMNYAPGEDGPNKFRRLLRHHFSHVASRPGAREGLFAYELWGGLTSDEMIRRVRTLKAKGLAYEDLWIDAGWYGNSKKCDDAYTGDWHRWTGDWVPNARIHPKGLTDVRDAAKDAGMGMMLWFEPERVVGSSNFAKEHPDMLIGNLLYYANPRGREYVRDLLSDFAERLGMSCYRQDFNFDPSGVMKGHDGQDREGITEIRHITGLYQMWDELLARHPKLLIDNCASGGRRIDIESMRRTVPFFRSDYQCGFNANADVMQAHNAGLSRLIPCNGCTVKLSDAYSLRSAYSTSHGVAYWNAIFQKEEKVDWAAAKKCCDEYRRIRRYFPCDFHNHGSAGLDPTAWAIWQYNDPERKEGVVLAFRRAESPSNRASVSLKGLPAGAAVEVENLDTGAKTIVSGELEIELPERRSSTVLLYRAGTAAEAPSPRTVTVRPVDGDATATLQKAFDDCFLAGGGTVTVEKGEYAVKGLRLRSNTTLLLKSGAVLKASRNCDDYGILAGDRIEPVPTEDFAPGVVWVTPRKRKTNDHLLKCASRWNNGIIRILRARNVRIVGEPGSVIDGCDSYDPIGEEHFRGVHGISVHGSTNCVFTGYTIRNTGNWAHNVWRSADLKFEKLTILGGHDGIHFSTCDRVAIAECEMKTGDDCVAGFDNEDVTVRGCLFNTACSAFRFGGRRVLAENCRAYGPGEYPIRNSLPKADQISGSHGAPGAGRRTLLALFTYYSDFTIKVRHDPGEITVRNCRVENAQRFLHYNFSGNETWQKNRPLRNIRFENIEATGLSLSLCAYGDKDAPLDLSLEDCRLSFAKPQRELIRAAHVGSLTLKGVSVEGVEGPCVRSWGNVATPTVCDVTGVEPKTVDADVPFRVNPI